MNQVPCHARSGARPAHPRGRGGERGESGGIRFRRREIQCFGGHRPRGLPGGAGRIGGRRRPAGTRRAWNYRSEISSAEFIRRVVPRGFAWRCPVGPRGDAPGGPIIIFRSQDGRRHWLQCKYSFRSERLGTMTFGGQIRRSLPFRVLDTIADGTEWTRKGPGSRVTHRSGNGRKPYFFK